MTSPLYLHFRPRAMTVACRYTVSQPKDAAKWKFSTGRVTQEMFLSHLFTCSGPESLALMCGPPVMLEHCCVPFLEKMGYSKEQMIHF